MDMKWDTIGRKRGKKTNTENTLDSQFMNALASEMKYRLREMNFI